jgi:hypothetical protein
VSEKVSPPLTATGQQATFAGVPRVFVLNVRNRGAP